MSEETTEPKQQLKERLRREALESVEQMILKCKNYLTSLNSEEPIKHREFSGFLEGSTRQFHRFLQQQALPSAEIHVKKPPIEQETNNKDEFDFHSIGFLSTPFVELNGTPRQASLARHVPGILHLSPHVQPSSSLKGLENFSHVWILSVFHANTSVQFRPMVSPPLLHGLKTGCFGCRTPHRPNNISLSLCEIESIDLKHGTIHLLGCDQVNNTPVLDLKPFVPADIPNLPRFPAWINTDERLNGGVIWEDPAKEQLKQLISSKKDPKIRVLRTIEETISAVEDVLRLDPRTVHAQEKHTVPIYGVTLDGLNFVYQVDDTLKSSRIIRVEPWPLIQPLPPPSPSSSVESTSQNN